MHRTISQRELRNSSAEVMDAVVAGETVVVTRNGREVAELRPVGKRRAVPRTEALQAFRLLPSASFAALRAEADDAFGDDTTDD